MANMGLQLIGFFLGLLGWFGTVITTIIPHWRRKAHVGANIITAIEVMEGLWMQCIWQSTGIYQCQVHRSQLALSDTLRAMRAMMVISCLLSALGAGVSVVGMKCTVCLGDSSAKGHMAVLGGICFILGGISCLIPVSCLISGRQWQLKCALDNGDTLPRLLCNTRGHHGNPN
uniref:Claudin n=1 Tax=Callorhinchus milii TaxID=7868 RepID=A0A4W3HG90_CALMI